MKRTALLALAACLGLACGTDRPGINDSRSSDGGSLRAAADAGSRAPLDATPDRTIDTTDDAAPQRAADARASMDQGIDRGSTTGPRDAGTQPLPRASIHVDRRYSLHTTEWGGTASVAVTLSRAPTSAVEVDVSSSDPTEGTPSPSLLVFTPTNWSSAQRVDVTGQDDPFVDGDQNYAIVLAPARGLDVAYNGLDPVVVQVTNGDNDRAEIVVLVGGANATPQSQLLVTESGDTDSFALRLEAQPSAAVTIPLSLSDATKATLSATALVFTPENWRISQAVTVSGLTDSEQGREQRFSVIVHPAASSDPAYAGLDGMDLPVAWLGLRSRGVLWAQRDGLVSVREGTEGTVSLRLAYPPRGTVTLPVSVAEATRLRVAETELVFTPSNWSTPQTLHVLARENDVREERVESKVVVGPALSAGADYAAAGPYSTTLLIDDNDESRIQVSATEQSLREGATTSLHLNLTSLPSAPVTVALSQTGAASLAFLPSLTLDATNWKTGVGVTVTAVDDELLNGTRRGTIVPVATSPDPYYSRLSLPSISVEVSDDDATPDIDFVGLQSADHTFVVSPGLHGNGIYVPLTFDDTVHGTFQVMVQVKNPFNESVVVELRGSSASFPYATRSLSGKGSLTTTPIYYPSMPAMDKISLAKYKNPLTYAFRLVMRLGGGMIRQTVNVYFVMQ